MRCDVHLTFIMTKKRNITPNRAEYNKQVKRIQQFQRRAQKRGFSIDIDIPKPQRVTKQAIERLKNLTAEELYKKAEYRDPITGLTMSGTEGRKLERQRAAQKGLETKRKKKTPEIDFGILNNIMEIINRWSPNASWSKYWQAEKTRQRNILLRLLEGAIAQYGRKAVAKRLQNNAVEATQLVEFILYASEDEQINFAMARFARIIKGEALTLEESMEISNELDEL